MAINKVLIKDGKLLTFDNRLSTEDGNPIFLENGEVFDLEGSSNQSLKVMIKTIET